MARASGPRTDRPAVAAPPESKALAALRRRAARCRACPLYARATQTVFGEGPASARIMLIGEQPGDQEDRAGRPFVGPAGKLLDRALTEAGLDRSAVYLTNTVKHFKWTPAGKRRLHQKPSPREIAACRPWLDAELNTLAPDLVIALGATAAQSLMGRAFRVTRDRGRAFFDTGWSRVFVATVHPSSILRGSPAERDDAFQAFVQDLRQARTQARA